jgi:ribosomal protein S18 acetylase RimI-like enzyme
VDARRLGPSDAGALDAFVASRPPSLVFLLSAARRGAPGDFLGAFDGARLAAVAHGTAGASAVVAGEPRALRALGALAGARGGRLRRLAGREEEATAFLDGGGWPPPAPITRRHVHMALDSVPAPGRRGPRIERPGRSDVPALVALAREFSEDDDPPGADPASEADAEARVRARLAAGATWILREGGVPAWKADVAVDEREGALVAGVVTARSARRRGLAKAGLSSLCARLLDRGASHVALHVNEGNAAARGLYDAIGFRETDRLVVGYAARVTTAARRGASPPP